MSHQELAAAFGQPLTTLFSGKVADYSASRPDYPASLFDWLAERIPSSPQVLDLGAGTGLLTQGLLARGWRVLAVEPDEAMRAECDRRLRAQPHYRSAPGQAEALPAADASQDLITAAQCFHWFDVPRARAECRRALRAGGQMALIWNDRQPDDPLQRDLDTVFARFGGAGRGAQLAQDERGQIAAFFGTPFARWQAQHVHALSLPGLLALAFSRSYMPPRGSVAGAAAQAQIEDLFARHARGGTVAMRYLCRCYLG